MDILGHLPVEIAHEILDYLPAKDLGSCSKVSSTWRSLTDCTLLWRRRCRDYGWFDKSFIELGRTHQPEDQLGNNLPLWPLNEWAMNFQVHYKLPYSWAKQESRHYFLSPEASDVIVFSCDERILAIGHANGAVSVLDVLKVPRLWSSFQGILPGFAVLGIIAAAEHIVLIQSMLLQIYHGDQRYKLIDAKSFEMGFSMIEVFQNYKGPVSNFCEWYTRQPTVGRVTTEKIKQDINFQVFDGVLYVGVRDYQMIYGWALENGKRVRTVHIPNRKCKLRDFLIHNKIIYIIYASRNVRHITAYDIANEIFIYEITTPECKTQKLLAGQYLIGVAISGPGLTTPGVIKVWEKISGKEIASRQTEFVSFRTVTSIYDLIAYSEGRSISLWNPRNNALINRFSFEDVISYLMPCPIRFILVIGNRTCWMFDWVFGCKLYRLFPYVVKNGDYRGLLFADLTMLLIKVDCTVIEMITFC